MATTIRALFDGEALRPEGPTNLRPNTTDVLTVEEAAVQSTEASADTFPLTEIARLSMDMGLTDLAERHGRHAHGRLAWSLHQRRELGLRA